MRVLIHQTAVLEESDIWTTCTAIVGVGQFCEQSVPKGAPVSLCKPHLVSAFLYCENLIVEQATQRDYGMSAEAIARRNGDLLRAAETEIVYYAKIDGLIKIGASTTRNLNGRMRALSAESVLATERGYYELERKRHRQFHRSRATDHPGREYFHPTEDLLDHVGQLRAVNDAERSEIIRLFGGVRID